MSAQQIQYAKKGVFTALAIFLAGYLFVILLTYTPNDPSWSHISSDMNGVSNMGGVTGAWIADLLYMFFGWFAWFWLAVIAYEAAHLWWQRQQPMWVLRLIAYVFLFFSGSALCAEIGAFINQHTQALSAQSLAASLHTGGIIGVEVSSRLAHLLTPLGALVFLLLFFIIAITYAFNIHWLALLRHMGSLTWLGSGVKSSIDATDGGYANDSQFEAEVESVQQPEADKYGQLPLTLPAQINKQSQVTVMEEASSTEQTPSQNNNLNSKGVLEEFLENSGLRETILQFRQEKEEQKQKQADAEHSGELAKTSTHVDDVIDDDSDTQHAVHAVPILAKKQKSTIEPSGEKIEPSFAWNNPQAIDELLKPDNESQANKHLQEQTPSQNQQSHTQNQDIRDKLAQFNQQYQSKPQTQEQDDVLVENDKALVEQNDKHASIEIKPSSKRLHIEDVAQNENHTAAHKHSMDNDAINFDTLTNIQQQETEDSFIDLTPSNTPPADPTQAPVAIDFFDTDDAVQQTNADSFPIKFAVVEGDESNHITEMVVDDEDDGNHDDDNANLSLPSVDDDAAFLGRSRAMQTAKYRQQLTPIPELSILDKPDPDRKPSYTVTELEQLSELLEIKLQEFNVKAEVVNAIPGPVVTRFEVELAAGVKASKVTGISRDLARSLSMASLRVVEVIPGKPYIGIEVPNKKREMVRLIELLDTEKYKDPKAQISMAMGKDIGGKPIITDLAKAPHMLVAGTTGSGKSVLVNAMLLSMLLKYKPDELRLILIDPKQLELANYNDIPHLLTPVVTDMNEAASSLSWCVAEMERRYQLMSLLKVRKLGEFNKKVIAAQKAGRPMIDPLWRPNDSVSIDQAPKLKTLPMIVIVADEFADMIMQVGKQAEELITRLAQKSRAAGIHLMLATQRPSVDVITGLIKANIPVRAALRVNSKVDSRTILDSGGAEDMLGNGDMLFLGPGQIEPDRVHGAYVSDEEVNRVCDAWRERGAPDYIDNMASNFELASPNGSGGNTSGEDDDLYDEAVAFVMETRKVSASSIQRKFSIGYNRAARIVDSMEEAGLVSAMGKSGKRELLM